jgi:hypothetical protein
MFRISLQLLSEAFLILKRSELDTITDGYWSACEVLVALFGGNET